MQPFEVSFLDPYGHPDRGVDHLGMRVAGEAAYSKLIDFITTVSWRPRYFSFLCWSLQKAWESSSKKSKNGIIKVNKTLQRSILKRLDYAVAASTLLKDTDDIRIILRFDRDEKSYLMKKIDIDIYLPPGFPDKYRKGVIKAVEMCTVKRNLVEPPIIQANDMS